MYDVICTKHVAMNMSRSINSLYKSWLTWYYTILWITYSFLATSMIIYNTMVRFLVHGKVWIACYEPFCHASVNRRSRSTLFFRRSPINCKSRTTKFPSLKSNFILLYVSVISEVIFLLQQMYRVLFFKPYCKFNDKVSL